MAQQSRREWIIERMKFCEQKIADYALRAEGLREEARHQFGDEKQETLDEAVDREMQRDKFDDEYTDLYNELQEIDNPDDDIDPAGGHGLHSHE